MRILKLLCRIGIHSWVVTPATYVNELQRAVAIPKTPGSRECRRCDVRQIEDIHCLGLNPPEYVSTWRIAKPTASAKPISHRPCCPDCGENLHGDGYTTVIRCPNADPDASDFCAPDEGPFYCGYCDPLEMRDKSLPGFSEYPIFKKGRKFGFYNEAGEVEADGYDSEVEAAYRLGRYCYKLDSDCDNLPKLESDSSAKPDRNKRPKPPEPPPPRISRTMF